MADETKQPELVLTREQIVKIFGADVKEVQGDRTVNLNVNIPERSDPWAPTRASSCAPRDTNCDKRRPMWLILRELSASGLRAGAFEGSGDLDCLCIAKGGIGGWWSTPAAKVNVTARGQGDGGHDVSEDDISYASRAVTLHWNANASSRDELLALTDSVRRLVHRQVRMRVVQNHGTEDTCCSRRLSGC